MCGPNACGQNVHDTLISSSVYFWQNYGYIANIIHFITSAKEVMFLPGFVCGCVCLCICEQDNSKTYGQILMKFSGYV